MLAMNLHHCSVTDVTQVKRTQSGRTENVRSAHRKHASGGGGHRTRVPFQHADDWGRAFIRVEKEDRAEEKREHRTSSGHSAGMKDRKHRGNIASTASPSVSRRTT